MLDFDAVRGGGAFITNRNVVFPSMSSLLLSTNHSLLTNEAQLEEAVKFSCSFLFLAFSFGDEASSSPFSKFG